MNLTEWQHKLDLHFRELRRTRAVSCPIFALEHGLKASELTNLENNIRAHIAEFQPSEEHWLCWILYAAEVGYRYTGDEYWQTFEAETPGWTLRGDRYWIRECFRLFHRKFGGAKPSGVWAEHFSIICWPITHAVLPRDLQRQLARILYQIRHAFSADLFGSPDRLGELIAARSWDATSRFQKLAQETLLVGQIATALLLEGQLGSAGLLLPVTLKRIGTDLDRERSSREWLRGARRLARERARFKGLSGPAARSPAPPGSIEHAREEVAALGIEPRLILRPKDPEGTSWDAYLEVPDLSHLLIRLPESRGALTESRCVVAGNTGPPLARGRLLHGTQLIPLNRWPRPDEVLLQFERSTPQLDYLLRTECLLRPGSTWLFRIASDRLARELRSLRVRPGQRYVIISTVEPITLDNQMRHALVTCEGVHAALVDLTQGVSLEWEQSLARLGLSQAKSIQVWPAGLAPVAWDGDGRGEWLTTDSPCLGIRADHSIESVTIVLVSDSPEVLELGPMGAGVPVFVQLPSLSPGIHKLQVRAVEIFSPEEELLGELDLVIKEPRSWTTGITPQGPFIVHANPPNPTLDELWETRVDLELLGPKSRVVTCTISLFDKDKDSPIVRKSLPALELPVKSATWKSYFHTNFRRTFDVQKAYDTATICDIDFHADELGSFHLRCEREFTALRWTVRPSGNGYTARLLDDSGAEGSVEVERLPFETPDAAEKLDFRRVMVPFEVPQAGGMFVAKRDSFVARVIIPPVVHGFEDFLCNPRILNRTRSAERLQRVLSLITEWSNARLTGNVLAETRQREVLLTFMRHLFFIIGGEKWERAEFSFWAGESQVQQFKRAISSKIQEAGFAAALAMECGEFSKSSESQRIGRLASLVHRFLGVGESKWMCEFALRFATNPHNGLAWAGSYKDHGFKQLMENPTLARAARFLVLVVSRQAVGGTLGGRQLYAGWQWN